MGCISCCISNEFGLGTGEKRRGIKDIHVCLRNLSSSHTWFGYICVTRSFVFVYLLIIKGVQSKKVTARERIVDKEKW